MQLTSENSYGITMEKQDLQWYNERKEKNEVIRYENTGKCVDTG